MDRRIFCGCRGQERGGLLFGGASIGAIIRRKLHASPGETAEDDPPDETAADDTTIEKRETGGLEARGVLSEDSLGETGDGRTRTVMWPG